jgi:hypothetical protein
MSTPTEKKRIFVPHPYANSNRTLQYVRPMNKEQIDLLSMYEKRWKTVKLDQRCHIRKNIAILKI